MQQRADEGGFASDAVTEMSEQDRADGTRDERQSEGRERCEECGGVVARRKKQLREDQHCGCGVDVEVEEFDRRSDHGGDDDTRSWYLRGRNGGTVTGDGRGSTHDCAPEKGVCTRGKLPDENLRTAADGWPRRHAERP